MTRAPHGGFFITFEGGEGAGKSSQVKRLAEHLRRLGASVILTREPGGSPGAELLHELLLSGTVREFGPAAEAMIFSSARIDHLDQTIRPALARGDVMICDRFIDSTRAYQGASGQLEAGFIDRLERIVIGVGATIAAPRRRVRVFDQITYFFIDDLGGLFRNILLTRDGMTQEHFFLVGRIT